MKILHVSYFPDYSAGVFFKISNAAESSYINKCNVDFMIINKKFESKENNIFYRKISEKFSVIKENFFFYDMIEKIIPFEDYDYIILRHHIYSSSFVFNFFRKYGNKIIIEFHTNEFSEIVRFNIWNLKKMFMLINNFFSFRYLRYCAGFIGMSDEILRKNLNYKIRNTKPLRVISNGLNVKNIPITGFEKFNGKVLNMIFLSAKFQDWQGLDRLLKSLIYYNGEVTIKLNLVGEIISSEEKKLIELINKKKKNVKIFKFGMKFGKELDDIFRSSSLAVSPLCLYRKKLDSTSSIKDCEYISRGIPFITGYNDSNLNGDENFVLKLSNSNDIIDIEKIIEFSEKVSNILFISEKMRKYAENFIDYKYKINQYEKFAEEIELLKK